MKKAQAFGGDWTEDKLKRLGKYLKAYTKIFAANPNARFLTTVYVDAFASTGDRAADNKNSEDIQPDADTPNTEIHRFLDGSVRIALEVKPEFDQYLFIELDSAHCQELERNLNASYPELIHKIKIENAEANQYLKNWCQSTDWSKKRAVLFLDPFGMQVEWSLLEAIAGTHAIDMWLLFPIGMGVNRLLTRSEPPPKPWADRLTKALGTYDWREAFYPSVVDMTLFGDVETQSKKTSFAGIANYFVARLNTIFPNGVAENPILLRNSRNTPLYLLCFATSSQKESVRRAALDIAQDILKR
ncbi:MAG: three-Cys-motif partner protein TcmP [Janthinobacterium lividum]